MSTASTEPTAQALPFTIKEKLLALQNALLAQNPGFATILSAIHGETAKHPEYVFAMSDEEFQTVVEGYSRYTKITIDVGKVTKKQAALLTEEDI